MSFASDLTGLGRLIDRARKLERPDAIPLMKTWMKVIEKDNRDGVLKGTDRDGAPLAPVKYRPKLTVETYKIFRGDKLWGYGPRLVARGEKLTLGQKNTANPRARRGSLAGFGPIAAGFNNNLTSSEYRRLDGPPLSPRRQFSRVITNLVTSYIEPEGNSPIWTAVGTWREVVSTKGVQFLPYHFEGKGRLPVRNLAGVRPEGRAEARRVAVNWLRLLVRGLPVTARDVA